MAENKWIKHIKMIKAQKQNKGKGLKEIIKIAKKSYVKVK